MAHLATAAAQGQHAPLVEALKTRQQQREAFITAIAAHESLDPARIDRRKIAQRVEQRSAKWRASSARAWPRRGNSSARFSTPFVLTPKNGVYHFAAELTGGRYC